MLSLEFVTHVCNRVWNVSCGPVGGLAHLAAMDSHFFPAVLPASMNLGPPSWPRLLRCGAHVRIESWLLRLGTERIVGWERGQWAQRMSRRPSPSFDTISGDTFLLERDERSPGHTWH